MTRPPPFWMAAASSRREAAVVEIIGIFGDALEGPRQFWLLEAYRRADSKLPSRWKMRRESGNSARCCLVLDLWASS